jgi:hypothetical protein
MDEQKSENPNIVAARARRDEAKKAFEDAGGAEKFVSACKNLHTAELDLKSAEEAAKVASEVTRPPQLDMPHGLSGGPGLPQPRQPGLFERLASSLTSLMGGGESSRTREPESQEVRAEANARNTYYRQKGVFEREVGPIRRLAYAYMKAQSDLNALEGKRVADNSELNATALLAMVRLPAVSENQLDRYILPRESR